MRNKAGIITGFVAGMAGFLAAVTVSLSLPSCVSDSGYPDVSVFEADGIVTLYENDIRTAGGAAVDDPLLIEEITAYNPYAVLGEGESVTDAYRFADMMFYDEVPAYCSGLTVAEIIEVDDGHLIVGAGRDGNPEAAAEIDSYGLLKYSHRVDGGEVTPYEYLYRTVPLSPVEEMKLPLVAFVLLTLNPDYDPDAEPVEGVDTTEKYLVELSGVFCNEFSSDFPAGITDGQYLITYGYTLTLKRQ